MEVSDQHERITTALHRINVRLRLGQTASDERSEWRKSRDKIIGVEKPITASPPNRRTVNSTDTPSASCKRTAGDARTTHASRATIMSASTTNSRSRSISTQPHSSFSDSLLQTRLHQQSHSHNSCLNQFGQPLNFLPLHTTPALFNSVSTWRCVSGTPKTERHSQKPSSACQLRSMSCDPANAMSVLSHKVVARGSTSSSGDEGARVAAKPWVRASTESSDIMPLYEAGLTTLPAPRPLPSVSSDEKVPEKEKLAKSRATSQHVPFNEAVQKISSCMASEVDPRIYSLIHSQVMTSNKPSQCEQPHHLLMAHTSASPQFLMPEFGGRFDSTVDKMTMHHTAANVYIRELELECRKEAQQLSAATAATGVLPRARLQLLIERLQRLAAQCQLQRAHLQKSPKRQASPVKPQENVICRHGSRCSVIYRRTARRRTHNGRCSNPSSSGSGNSPNYRRACYTRVIVKGSPKTTTNITRKPPVDKYPIFCPIDTPSHSVRSSQTLKGSRDKGRQSVHKTVATSPQHFEVRSGVQHSDRRLLCDALYSTSHRSDYFETVLRRITAKCPPLPRSDQSSPVIVITDPTGNTMLKPQADLPNLTWR